MMMMMVVMMNGIIIIIDNLSRISDRDSSHKLHSSTFRQAVLAIAVS